MKITNIKRYLDKEFGFVESLINNKKAFIKFNKEYFDYTDLSYDGFLILMLPLAMKNHEDIYLDGKISFRLYYKLIHNIMPIIKIVHPTFKLIKINHQGFNTAKYNSNDSVGCGLSCGVDSLCCIEDFYFKECGEYKLTHVTNFNAGSYTLRDVYKNKLINIKKYISETDLGFLQIDSNFAQINNLEHQYFHTLRNLSIPLFFQKLFKTYYYASCFSYQDSKFVENSGSITSTEPVLIPLLSTENLEFIIHGAQYTRVKKTEIISKNQLSMKYLDICVAPKYYVKIQPYINCSKCFKCMRTLFTLEYLGVLNKYNRVFDINIYFKYKENYLKTLVTTNPYDRELKKLIKNNNKLLNSSNVFHKLEESNEKKSTFWYAYKKHWKKIDSYSIKSTESTFLKININENSSNLHSSEKIEIKANQIYRLHNNQNIDDYYILYF